MAGRRSLLYRLFVSLDFGGLMRSLLCRLLVGLDLVGLLATGARSRVASSFALAIGLPASTLCGGRSCASFSSVVGLLLRLDGRRSLLCRLLVCIYFGFLMRSLLCRLLVGLGSVGLCSALATGARSRVASSFALAVGLPASTVCGSRSCASFSSVST